MTMSNDVGIYQVYQAFLGVELTIGILFVWDLQMHRKINHVLKWLFFIYMLNTVALSISYLTQTFMDPDTLSPKFETLLTAFLQIDFVVIFSTLVWRVHVSFAGTVYEMSKGTKIKFGVLLFLLIALPMPWSVVNLIFKTRDEVEKFDEETYGSFTLLFVFVFLVFAVGAISAVRVFQSNLIALAKTQAESVRDITKTAELNQRQQSMIALASKYLLLFCIASMSSILLLVIDPFGWIPGGYLYTLDQWVNIYCLYLQFGHTAHCYDFACKYPDKLCHFCIGFKVKRWQKRNKHRRNLSVPSMTSTGSSTKSTEATTPSGGGRTISVTDKSVEIETGI